MRRGAALVVVVLVSQLVGVASAQAAPGDLDPTCDSDGKATTSIDMSRAVDGVAVQSDGKIVTVGDYEDNNPGTTGSNGYVVARYLPGCVLDTTFGVAQTGKVIVVGRPTLNAVAIQPDQKILVAGGDGDFFVARYNPDGTLDATFGKDGKATTDVEGSVSVIGGGSIDMARALAVQPDGKIVLVGDVEVGFAAFRFGLVRYLPTGAIDPTFGTNGRVIGAISGSSANYANAVAIQPDGKIVLAGQACLCSGAANFAFALVRYLPTGLVDPSFGSRGEVLTDFNFKILTQNDTNPISSTRQDQDRAYGVALQPDGKIVAVGATGNGDFAVANYNPDGSLNTGFNGDGRATTDMAAGSVDVAYALAVQQDGKVVAAGGAGTGTGTAADFALVRYNTNGTLDTTFSGDGKLTTDFSGGEDAAYGLAVQANGRIVAAGQAAGHFAISRYVG